MSTAIVKQHDTARAFTDTLTVGGVALNLSTATLVNFVLELPTGSVDRVATVVSAVAGTVSYTPVAADVATIGTFRQHWKVTFAEGRIVVPSNGYNYVQVQEALT